MERLRIAVQKKGRLNEKSMKLIEDCGIHHKGNKNTLCCKADNFPMEILFLRDDDIPKYIADGVADIGIVGENEIDEQRIPIEKIRDLGFSKCRLSLAIRKEEEYNGPADLNGKTIATSYPNLVQDFLDEYGIQAEIHEISGSVEIAPAIGLTDAICDLVSTGSTLLFNGLKEVQEIYTSTAILAGAPNLSSAKRDLLDKLLLRIQSVKKAQDYKYIRLNAPNERLDDIVNIIPGFNSPTITPLALDGWSTIHSVIPEDEFWEKIEQLKELGAEGIMITPLEKMIA